MDLTLIEGVIIIVIAYCTIWYFIIKSNNIINKLDKENKKK